MTTALAASTNYVLLSNRLADLVKAYNRHRAWHDLIDRYGVYRAAGLHDEAKAIRGNKRPPGKDAKYHMYDDAGAVQRLLAAAGHEVARADTLDDIGTLIDTARKVIAADAPKQFGPAEQQRHG